MNILNKAAVRGLKKNRTRTVVTIIGVILAVAMITAVTTLTVSLQNYMVNGSIQKYGDWHVGFEDVDFSFSQEQAMDERTADTASFQNIGYAALEGGANPDKPYLFIAGFNDKTFDILKINLVSGRQPANSSEILIPAHAMSNGGAEISVGDRLILEVGERRNADRNLCQHDSYGKEEIFVPTEEKTYTVVGIYERPAFEEYTAPGYTAVTVAGGADTNGSYSTFVSLKNPYQVHSYAESVSESGAYVLNDNVLRFMGLSDDRVFNVFLYTVGGILIALIVVGAVFLIYNSFTISLSERVRQFGMLLSVGATERQLCNSVLFEAVCIGVVGIPIGMLIGIPAIGLVLSLTARNFQSIMYDGVAFDLHISVPVLAVTAVISMLTILISAYIPARRAARTPVMECIRQTNEVKIEGKTVKTSKFAERACGLEGNLALKNFRRNRKRYRSIVLSLVLSVVLFVAASSFAAYLKSAVEGSTVDLDYDICFYTENMGEEELSEISDRLKTAFGVYESSSEVAAMEGQDMTILTFRSENPAQSVSDMRNILAENGITSGYTLQNVAQSLEENRNILFIVNLFSTVFIVMMTLVAVTNVFNTISTNIRLRRRELAMLRSVGMSDRSFDKMMRFECGLYSLRTLLFGLPAAVVVSWLIYRGFSGGEDRVEFIFPWGSMGISILGVFLVIFVTMLYVVRKIKKENIIDILRDELT